MVNIDFLSTRLISLSKAMKEVKALGVSDDILICWLRVKTGLSQKDIKLYLKSTEDFFDKLINKEALKKL